MTNSTIIKLLRVRI